MFTNEIVADVPPAIVYPHTHAAAPATKPYQSNIDFRTITSQSSLIDGVVEIVKKFENSQSNPHGGFNKTSHKWFPHHSLEGGSDTIAYGHKILPGENFSGGLSEHEALNLLKKDIEAKMKLAKTKIHNFETLTPSAKTAIINAFYRGDIGKNTIHLINQNNLSAAAKEYLNHSEYKHTSDGGVKKRMELNAALMAGKIA